MKHLLFAGPGNVGKTTLIARIAQNLITQGFNIDPEGASTMNEKWGYGLPRRSHEDFYLLLKKNGKYMVIYSWGDTKALIQWLSDYLQELRNRGLEVSHVIMATRDGSETLYGFTYSLMKLNASNTIEIPMGRMVRGPRRNEGMDWYVDSMTNLVQAFVLPDFLS